MPDRVSRIVDRISLRDTCIVDQDVDPFMTLQYRLHNLVDLIPPAHVAEMGAYGDPLFAHRPRGFFQAALIPVADRDPDTLLSQLEGNGSPDSASSACDQCDRL